jgi:Recombination endonuclease VII
LGSRSERDAAKAKKEKAHDRYVQRTYGLAPGEYNARLAAQAGGCAICGKKPRKRYLAVDHDHRTGRVRGLLCYMCNTALGVWEFDRATALRASEYLLDIHRRWVPDPREEPSNTTQRVEDDLPF